MSPWQEGGEPRDIISIIENQQPALMRCQPLFHRRHHLRLISFMLLGKLKLASETHQITHQCLMVFGTDPEDERIDILVAIGVLNSNLSFADATQATNCLSLRQGRCGALL